MDILNFKTAEDLAEAATRVADHLRSGGLIAYPTETVYGLGCRAEAADVARLSRLKGRSARKPFLLLAASVAMVKTLQLDLRGGGYAATLADAFWPGPLTLVLNGAEGKLPDALRGPEGGIAVRVTSHELVRHLIRQLGMPITSTSANRPGSPPAAGVGALKSAFGEDSDLLVLDGGVLGHVPPSTIVDCTGADPGMIREGAISRAEISAAISAAGGGARL